MEKNKIREEKIKEKKIKSDSVAIIEKLDTPEKVHSYYRKIIINMPNNVYWLDRNCITQGCNNNILKLVGLKKLENFIGITYKEMGVLAGWTEGQAQSFERDDREVMATGIPKFNIEEPPVYDKKGNPRYFISSRVPIFDDNSKEVIGVVGISVDITERKKQEKALELAKERAEVANQAKTEFLENMRHDIRTPLTGIVGCAELLQTARNPKQTNEYIQDLIQSSYALLDFLNKVLEDIQIATGEIPLVKKKFDLRKQLKAIFNLNRALAAEKQLSLCFDYDKSIPKYLIGDPIRVERIVLELITNALTFTKTGTVNLNVTLKKKEGKQLVLEIMVKDTGIGIPKEQQEAIFQRFKRLTPSYQGIYKGLGLGLTTVKQFIDDLEGEIYVNSELGQGTTFTCLIEFKEPLLMDGVGIDTIQLPRKLDRSPLSLSESDARETTESVALENLNIHTSRILLVEDNLLAARIVQIILSDFDCTIDHAPNAKTAMDLLQQNDYQLIFMDIGLPDMDGIALTHRIRLKQWRKHHATIPIIGLTAHVDKETKQKCLDAGMNLVILKPLKKEVAKELLTTFVKNEMSANDEKQGSDSFSLPVIDFDEVKRLLNNNQLVEDCRQLIISGITADLIKLDEFYQAENWKAIEGLAHQWQGAASYYAAKRLRESCKQFSVYQHSHKPQTKQLKALYLQLIVEMKAVKQACFEHNETIEID